MPDATSETGTVGSLCFSFLCSALYIIVCSLVHFLLAILLSVLQFTASVYTFGIFKLIIFNHRGTEVVKCMLLVILQRTDGLVYHLNSSCTQCWIRDTSDP